MYTLECVILKYDFIIVTANNNVGNNPCGDKTF